MGVAFSEELIWRGIAQPLVHYRLGSAVGAILVVSVFFALVHRHFFKNDFIVSAEFLLFSVILGVLYYTTASLVLVITIHAVRDIEIVYHEYLEKLEETGSEEEAISAIEKAHSRRRPLSV